MILRGIPAAPGIAIGRSFLYRSEELAVPHHAIRPADVPHEQERLRDAIAKTRSQIAAIQDRIAQEMGQEHAEIFSAHLLLLEDKTMLGEVLLIIEKEHKNAEAAFHEVIHRYIGAFLRMEDEYLRERTADIEDVRKRVLKNLTGQRQETLEDLPDKVVIVAADLSPSETAQMRKDKVYAFVTDIGGRTSHTAIMAKSLEIPAVVGLVKATQTIQRDDLLIVDGTHGEVYVNPDPSTVERFQREQVRIADVEKNLLRLKDLPAETLDGRRIELSANIELPTEAASVIAHGADGIGLYRTEFFYMNRSDLPTEEEQFQAYKEVVQQVTPDPVVIRTLDLGGDKFVSQLDLPHEMNPFMGWRAIRFCLARPEIFKVQLRAALRASVYGNIKLMYPMISGVEELQQANRLLREAQDELRNARVAFDEQIEVGAMIEVPSAALTCDLLAKEVKFFSIGTNDLIQYSLAVDRVNEKIAYLYDPAHPAVLRLVKHIVDTGHQHGLWVGMCGEMAGEPALSLLLLGLGIDELSTSPVLVPEIKKVIRSVEYRYAQEIAKEALTLSTGKEVEEFAKAKLKALVPEMVE